MKKSGSSKSSFRFLILKLLVLFSIYNLGTVLERCNLIRLPLNPILFFLGFFILVYMVRRRVDSIYLKLSWIFFSIYFVFGFFGQEVSSSVYFILQNSLKLWIVIIGFPFIMKSCCKHNEIEILIRYIFYTALVGSLCVLHQSIFPFIWKNIIMQVGEGCVPRPAGLWVNPNNGAMMLAFGYVLSFFIDDVPILNITFGRVLILLGVFLTFSRTALVSMVVFHVYWLFLKRNRINFIKAVPYCMFFLSILFFNQANESHFSRLGTILEVSKGDMSGIKNSRLDIWEMGFERIENFLVGRGHGGMKRVVDIGSGLDVHNYFLYFLGNSGILALLLFTAWLGYWFLIFLKTQDERKKLLFFASFLFMLMEAIVTSDFFHMQAFGPILGTLFVLGTAKNGGSSAESVGDLRLRKVAKCMI